MRVERPPSRPAAPRVAAAIALCGAGLVAGGVGGALPNARADRGSTATEAAGPADCAPYVGTSTWGLCARTAAVQAPTIEAMVALCAGAGQWEGTCRDAWVEQQFHNPLVDRAMLLRACGGEPDCAFKVLDHRPNLHLPSALDECARWARPYANDCAGHVLRRAYPIGPEEAGALRVEAPTWTASHAAAWIGATVACIPDTESTCEDAPPSERPRCESFASHLRAHPEGCPVSGGATGAAYGLTGQK